MKDLAARIQVLTIVGKGHRENRSSCVAAIKNATRIFHIDLTA